MFDKRKITWNAEGVTIYKHSHSELEGDKGMVIPNSRILELADQLQRDCCHKLIKRKLGNIDGINGVVMLEINSTPHRRSYQVYCAWMPNWHIQNLGSSIDLSYQDDGRGNDKVLSIIVRKKYGTEVKSITRVYPDIELNNVEQAIDIKRFAEDVIVRLDSQNQGG